jgi:DNA polymerase I-like protein with 3'-5' exonuclease and polymerase domains
MEGVAPELKIPLSVDVSIGKTWGDLWQPLQRWYN